MNFPVFSQLARKLSFRDEFAPDCLLQQRVGRTPRGSWLLHTSVRFGLTKNFTLTKRVDDAPVWSLSCFYVRKGYRRKGVTETLIGAALSAARCAKAPALEAYPLDAELTPSASSTGYASTFSRAGVQNGCAPGAPTPDYALRTGAKLARRGVISGSKPLRSAPGANEWIQENQLLIPYACPCQGWGRVWGHAFTFSLAACNICGRIFSIA